MNNFFKAPTYQSFERTQKAKVLHVTLLISAGACFLLGIQNLSYTTVLDTVLFVFSGLCLMGVVLNQRGYYYTVATFISIFILVLITFSLIDGIGLRDAAMITYPFFILFTSFLFSKKITPIATLLSAASVVLIFYMGQNSMLDPANYYPTAQFTNMVIIILAVGLLMWSITGSWERSLTNISEAYDRTLEGWAKALEYRDRETEGHSQRVTELCIRMGNKLGFSPIEIDNLRRGALLHDIGKMAIPDAVLLKNDSLTEEEWEIIKKHPCYAKRLIEDIPFLRPTLDIPYYHHERWDGSGYPEGLRGEEIPLAARIFSVIDVWDALLSDRPYRSAWSEVETRAYLREQSGLLFDPKVLEAFFELIDDPDTTHNTAI
jgi:hypothetical protein